MKSLYCLIILVLVGCVSQVKPPPYPTTTPPQYLHASWEQLPGWPGENILAGFLAWRHGCTVINKKIQWKKVCRDALTVPENINDIRAFIEDQFTVWQLTSPGNNSSRHGLITGYFEPIYLGDLVRTEKARFPIYGVPSDLITVDLSSLYPTLKGDRIRGKLVGQKLIPYPSHAEIVQKGLDAPIIGWLNDPVDLQFMHVQGSGRVQLPDGKQVRLGYANRNGHPYKWIGSYLIKHGELEKQTKRVCSRSKSGRPGILTV